MFHDLLPIAILGTANASVPQFPASDIDFPEHISLEEKLLLAFAYTSMREKAAFEPGTLSDAVLPECPAEKLPYTPQQVADIFDRILSNASKDDVFVVEEAMEKMAEKGRVISPHVLLATLNFAKQYPALAVSAEKIMGERGRWLTQYYMGNKPKKEKGTNWDTGTIEERARYFAQLYENHPAQSLELLREAWQTETVSQKKDFVRILHQKPREAAADFLYELLTQSKEKDTELKRLMAETLVKIPHTPFIEKLKSEVSPLISYKTKLLSGGKLEISFPKSFSPVLQELGVHEHSKAYENVTQGYLFQLIAICPPSFWENDGKISPQEWAKAAQKTAFFSSILNSIEQAAILHSDKKWLQWILEYHITEKSLNYYWAKPTMAFQNQDYASAIQYLAGKYSGRQMSYIFAARKEKWDKAESLLATQNLKDIAGRYGTKYPWECSDLTALADTAAQFAHADSLKELINILYQLSQQSTQWLNSLEKVIARMENRLAIHILMG